MTQADIVHNLQRLHFQGQWSKSAMAKHLCVSKPVLYDAMDGKMSRATQARLSMTIKTMPMHPPPPKRKPGKMKRYYIRYQNLMAWIRDIESMTRLNLYQVKNQMVTEANGGYICAKLDYILKRYILTVWGKELKVAKIAMGDCYSAEQWIKYLSAKFPHHRRDIWERLTKRRQLSSVNTSK